MTESQKQQVLEMRRRGVSFSDIAAVVGLSRNTIKSFARRVEIKNTKEPEPGFCLHCGKPLFQMPKTKPRRFCNEKCRYAYWNSHRCMMISKVNPSMTCSYCGKEFDAHGKKSRKYCGRQCYTHARWGEVSHG